MSYSSYSSSKFNGEWFYFSQHFAIILPTSGVVIPITNAKFSQREDKMRIGLHSPVASRFFTSNGQPKIRAVDAYNL